MHMQTRARVFTQAHVCTDTDTRKTQNKEQQQHNGVVTPSFAGWIYWLLCGAQFHPSHEDVLSVLLSSSSSPAPLLSVGASAPPLLSCTLTIIRALGATWSLAGWLGSLQSAGCKRGHLSRAQRVSGEKVEAGKGLFEEKLRIENTLF